MDDSLQTRVTAVLLAMNDDAGFVVAGAAGDSEVEAASRPSTERAE